MPTEQLLTQWGLPAPGKISAKNLPTQAKSRPKTLGAHLCPKLELLRSSPHIPMCHRPAAGSYVPCKKPSGFNSYTLPCPGLRCGAEPLQDVAGQSQALPTHISISNSRFTHGQHTLSHWHRAGRLILCLSAASGTVGMLATPEPATAPAVARGQGWMSWP